jgi:hypothetical protein
MIVFQLYPEGGVGEGINHHSVHFNDVFFCHGFLLSSKKEREY